MEERRERRRDVWLETGRQIVDGVSGRRPGQRRSSLDLESVGRWVGDKVECRFGDGWMAGVVVALMYRDEHMEPVSATLG